MAGTASRSTRAESRYRTARIPRSGNRHPRSAVPDIPSSRRPQGAGPNDLEAVRAIPREVAGPSPTVDAGRNATGCRAIPDGHRAICGHPASPGRGRANCHCRASCRCSANRRGRPSHRHRRRVGGWDDPGCNRAVPEAAHTPERRPAQALPISNSCTALVMTRLPL
jgi:hypothetical protein